jgi:hypothetical protein
MRRATRPCSMQHEITAAAAANLPVPRPQLVAGELCRTMRAPTRTIPHQAVFCKRARAIAATLLLQRSSVTPCAACCSCSKHACCLCRFALPGILRRRICCGSCHRILWVRQKQSLSKAQFDNNTKHQTATESIPPLNPTVTSHFTDSFVVLKTSVIPAKIPFQLDQRTQEISLCLIRRPHPYSPRRRAGEQFGLAALAHPTTVRYCQ